MPTGYTDRIKDGTTFADFALICVRAFGVCAEMRDDPNDAPIPEEFKPSDYHPKKLAEAEAELRLVQVMTEDQAREACAMEYAAEVDRVAKYNAEEAAEQKRYRTMLANVKAWTPPSPEHARFKEFMVEQLTASLSDYRAEEPKPLVWTEWLAKKAEAARKDIEYHREQFAKETERCERNTRWLRQLRESLK